MPAIRRRARAATGGELAAGEFLVGVRFGDAVRVAAHPVGEEVGAYAARGGDGGLALVAGPFGRAAGQLRAVARNYRTLALAHPHVLPLLVTRPLATPLALRPPGTLRPLEDVLALLTRAGFSSPDALHIYRALFGFLHGHVLNELQELVDNPDETDDLLRLGLHRLPIGDFPLLRGLAPVLAAYDGAAELERGLDILLTGLAITLPPPAGARLPAAVRPTLVSRPKLVRQIRIWHVEDAAWRSGNAA
jgi:Tetracyclin repressor-like, C-terminal domain